jgi:hypothetical protein
MPKGGIDRLADVPVRWLVLGFLIITIGTFVRMCAAGPHYENRSLWGRGSTVGETLNVGVGQELELILQSVGPGEYKSPPTVSSPSLQFLDATLIPPNLDLPSGLTQRFRFKGVAPGRAIVVIRHSGDNPVRSDTVNVR